MAKPVEEKWSFAALGLARQEVARLATLGVITEEEVRLLTAVVQEKEDRIAETIQVSTSQGIHSLYLLLKEEAREDASGRISPPLLESLQAFYSRHHPELVETTGLFEPPPTRMPTSTDLPPPEPEPEVPSGQEDQEEWSLARFLEALNIGWGMLAAGLLIVGCSLALVVTLWQSESLLVRYLTFLGVTLGLNSLGQIVRRALRLTMTGNALLVISLLLMPLNLIIADFLGDPPGQAVPPALRVGIVLLLALISWTSFRLIVGRDAVVPSLTFTGLVGLQLLVEPLREGLIRGNPALLWAGAALYLAGQGACLLRLHGTEKYSPSDNPAARMLWSAGLLAFAHVLLPARVLVEVLQWHHPGWFMPVAVLQVAGLLWVSRSLRSTGGHSLEIARAMDTLSHALLPLTLLLSRNEPGWFLSTTLLILVLQVRVAWWYRSRIALAMACALGAIAYYTGLVLVNEAATDFFSWLPGPVWDLAFQMLPLAWGYFLAGELLVRRHSHIATPSSWAAPVLLWSGRCSLISTVVLLMGSAVDLANTVPVLGALGFTFALLFGRREYAYLALAALPATLVLGPDWLPVIPEETMAFFLSCTGVACSVAGLLLYRSRASRLLLFSRPLLHVPLLTVPVIVVFSFVPEISALSVVSVLACMAICVLTALACRAWSWPEVAGMFYTLGAAQAYHLWVHPLTTITPSLTLWVAATAIPLLLGGIFLASRCGVIGRIFSSPALKWGFAILCLEAVLFLSPPTEPGTALSAWICALVLLAPAAHLRSAACTGAAAAFGLVAAFFTYHWIDPVQGPVSAWHFPHDFGFPRWLPLAPLAASVLFLGAGAALRGRRNTWKRTAFLKPLGMASVVAAVLTLCLTLADADARKVWTLSLALLCLVSLYFRMMPGTGFLVAFQGLAWLAMAGLVVETAPAPLVFTLLLPGTAAVAALFLLLEKGLGLAAARPGRAWLSSARSGSMGTGNLVTGSVVLGLLGWLLVLEWQGAGDFFLQYIGFERQEWWIEFQLVTLGLLLASWAWSAVVNRRFSSLTLFGLAGGLALAWITLVLDEEAARRGFPFALAVYATLWITSGHIRPVLGRAAWIGHTAWFFSLLTALPHPDHPGSVAAMGLITGLWFTLVRRPGGHKWLPWAVALGTWTALAGVHCLHPVIRDGHVDLKGLLPFCLLAFALAVLWYGLGRWALIRQKAGTMSGFRSGPLRAAGVMVSGLTLLLLTAYTLPALHLEPIGFQPGHLVGAALILSLIAGYLAVARWEKQPFFVYLAEACLAGFFLYMRLTHPWIYRHQLFRRFWPVILVGISYGAILLEELLRRVRIGREFLDPLRFTGLLLPIGPLVGVWFRATIDPTLLTTLGAIAAFYAMMSFLNRSVVFGYLATALANVTLMTFAAREGWDFRVHPQIFLWPVGLSLIAIAHVQRKTLPGAALQALRVLGACILHGSLATAIFTDLAHRNLEMILLAVISLVGILCGIGSRIRAFLYAGFGFLVFDVAYMVFLAGQEDTWIWWMSGIILGVLVLLTFAFFERQKGKVDTLVKELKTWE